MSIYTPLNMIVVLIGSFLFAGGNAYILFKENAEDDVEYRAIEEPVRSMVAPQLPLTEETVEKMEGAVQYVKQIESKDQIAELPTVQEVKIERVSRNQEEHLVLRLLSGDERTVFHVILDAGGEIYQKEIVEKTEMSTAKVSRVLDRLAEKGVITKERQGMSNKVRIELDV